METREEKLINLINLYEELINGKGIKTGMLNCLDSYYTDSFNMELELIDDVRKELNLEKTI